MAKKFDIQYYFSEGFHSIFTHGFMSFAAVCMIVACLLIMGSFTLVAVNLDNMLGDLEAENEFLAYVDESYTEEQARDIKSQIEAIPNVSQVTFVTRAEAMDDFRAGRENNELLADLPDEVLRDRFRIHVQDIKQLKATSEQVQKITGVAEVNVYGGQESYVQVRLDEQKLRQYGLADISEGTIYPLLLRLERGGLIAATHRVSPAGPRRKYFHITPAGRAELALFEGHWQEMAAAVGRLLRGGNRDEER